MTATGSGREGFADMALLVRAFQVSKMLAVAASLELADRVQDGPKPVTTLAADCGADAAMLLRLCRALAAFGIFAVDAEGAVSQSVRSEWLLKDAKPDASLRGALLDDPRQLDGLGPSRTRDSNRLLPVRRGVRPTHVPVPERTPGGSCRLRSVHAA
jgi:hypothetical protein